MKTSNRFKASIALLALTFLGLSAKALDTSQGVDIKFCVPPQYFSYAMKYSPIYCDFQNENVCIKSNGAQIIKAGSDEQKVPLALKLITFAGNIKQDCMFMHGNVTNMVVDYYAHIINHNYTGRTGDI